MKNNFNKSEKADFTLHLKIILLPGLIEPIKLNFHICFQSIQSNCYS